VALAGDTYSIAGCWLAYRSSARAFSAAAVAQAKITLDGPGKLNVPNNPTLVYVEGDGTGADIWASASRVIDASVEKAYGGERKIEWMEVLAGEKAFNETGEWLPQETIDAFREYLVGIKGPLTTPVGGGIRSLNVALRQILDLYTCLRPVVHFAGVPTPIKKPEDVDFVIFRENTEDIYAGIEFQSGSDEVKELLGWLQDKGVADKVRFPDTAAMGVKPVSREGTERLVKSAIQYALDNSRKSVTLVHKGNIMKFTEGGFKDWGYALAKSEYRNEIVTERESWILGNLDSNPDMSVEDNARAIEPGYNLMTSTQQEALRNEVAGVIEAIGATHGNAQWKNKVIVKDAIADIALQQILTRSKEFDVIATLNLNGDYLSDSAAALVGGIGIAPGANVNYTTGHFIAEATHGTAPKYAGLDKVNPGSVVLSGEMMLRYLGWNEAADLIIKGMNGAISTGQVTYDFHRLTEGATLLKCSEFGSAIIKHMD